MKTLNRKLLRELWRSKGLLLAIVAVLAVGVACYVTMNSCYRNLSYAKQRYYSQCRMADFWIDVKKAPVADLLALTLVEGIVEAQPRIQHFAVADIPDREELVNGQVISLPDRPEKTLNDIVIVQGGYFTERRANEVILNDTFARRHKLYPGEWIHLLLNNRRQELFIVGTAIAAEFTYMLGPGSLIPDPERFGVFYLKQGFAEDVFNMQGAANQVVGRLAPHLRDHPDDTLRRAEAALDAYGVADVTRLKHQGSNQYLSSEINGLGSFAMILPSIFLAVAVVVLNVFMSRLARQQRVVVGTLKALGYHDSDVFLHFLKFGLVIGATGSLFGSILGHYLAAFMTSIYQEIFDFPDLRNEVFLQSHAVGWACSLGCAALGSLLGARATLRLRPAEAMRPEPPRRGGNIALEHIPLVWNQLSSAWRIALRSLFRGRVRTAAAVFAAAMGMGLMLNGFMMTQGLREIIDFQLQLVVRSDVDLTLFDERGRDVLREAQQLPGVDYVEPTLSVACTFANGPYQRKAALTGLIPNGRLTTPRNGIGRPLVLPSSGISMNRHLATLLHVKEGDPITIVPIKGDRRPREAPVVQITDGFMGLAVYANLEYLSKLIDEEYAVNGLQLLIEKDPSRRGEMYRALKEMPAVQSVSERQEMINNLEATLVKTQKMFIAMFVMFAGAIFFSAVLNASLVSLAERQREVATFLAIGYTPWQVGNIFLRESMTANFVGTLLGIPAGYGLTVWIAHMYANDLVRFPVQLASWTWQLAALFSFVYALGAHAIVQYCIHTLDYQEALKVRE